MAIFKKSTRKRLPHETSGTKKFFRGLLISSTALSVLGGFWFLGQLGPKDVDFRDFSYNIEVLDSIKAIQQESIELEEQFEELLVLRKPRPEDINLLKKALDKQKEYLAATTGVDSEAYDRQLNLEERYQNLAAEHLLEVSLDLESKGEALASSRDYENARAKYREAFEAQKQINETFPLSSAYNVSRATRLQRQARYFTAEPFFQRSLAFEKEADLLIEAKEWEQAEERLEQAMDLQDKLNREYWGINQASVSRLEGLRVKLVGIRSGQSYLEVQRVAELADERRAANENLEAAAIYLEAARLQRQLNEAYRESPYASSERLYSLIMGTNPSRNQGDVRPVDSISWLEAKNFCERLSWILGKPVRLPTENDFRQALGRLRYVVIEEHVWSVSDAAGVPQAVGTKEPFASGFYDLLGNTSEWLESIDRFETEAAWHIGGHAQDRIESIFTVPLREAPRGERNRLTGFRIAVKVN